MQIMQFVRFVKMQKSESGTSGRSEWLRLKHAGAAMVNVMNVPRVFSAVAFT